MSRTSSVAAAPGTVGAGALPRNPDHPAGAATAPVSAPGRLDVLTASVRRGLAGTPGRMRVVAALAVVATLAFGLGAGQAFRSASGALERAGANAQQVVRVQEIHSYLSSANATATNAFLVGGLEPAQQRKRYDDAINAAAAGIVTAARAQPADAAALAALNAEVVAYANGVEQARANNRQALPVGATYLSSASDDLEARAIPLLDAIVTANSERAQTEFAAARRALLWLVLPGVLALGVLAGAMVWLARRTHRYVNLPLAGATVAVLVGLAAGWFVLAGISTRVDQVQSGPYSTALATAQARVSAFDAKAYESLTLIKRGSGATLEKAWQKASDRDPRPDRTGHQGVGRRPGVVELRPGAPGAAGARRRRQLGAGGHRRHEPRRHAAGQHQRTVRRVRHGVRRPARGRSRRGQRPSVRARRVAGARRCPRPAARAAGRRVVVVGRLAAAPGVPMRRRLPTVLAATGLALATVAGCGSGSYAPTPVAAAPATTPATPNPDTATPTPAATGAAVAAANCLQSYAPQGSPSGDRTGPDPQEGPAGRRRLGRLAAARRPQPGHRQDRGLRHRRPARRRPGDLRRPRQGRAAGDHRRRPHPCARQDGSVDIVARNMTITCDRWNADRLQHRVLPLRPEGARAPRVDRPPV